MGHPKALLRDPEGRPLVMRAVEALQDGGCAPVVVVLGAEAERARDLVDESRAVVVEALDWADGLGASLRAGLAAVAGADAAVVTLVDLPDVGADVVRRVLAVGAADPVGVVARATYDGIPGHPVLVGSAHWAGFAEAAVGDRGARDYLVRTQAVTIECGDLATGRDLDFPEDLR